ncbi:MAG: hypothetical protein U0R17_02430 [Acidimicrobiia bacterium]
MTFKLPPSNRPYNSPNERFYSFLERNAGQHGMPVLPSAFDDLEFYWTWHEIRPGQSQPFTLDMGSIAQAAMKSPFMQTSPKQFAFRAASLSEGSDAVICYDTPDAIKDGSSDAWLEKVSLKELVFQCAGNGLGAVFLSQGRMFQLSPGSVFRLTGIEIPTEKTENVGLDTEQEFGPSGLSQERQNFFRELIARHDDWIVPGTIEFVTCTAADGKTYEGVTLQVKPGVSEERMTRECAQLGEAITIVTNQPFAVVPQFGLEPGFER